MKKYIDANVFIQGILRDDNHSKRIILKIANNEFIGVTSVLSWDELTFVIRKFLGKDMAMIEGSKLFRLPNIQFIDVKKEIIQKAQKLFEKYNLQPRDAIHVATAINAGVNEIISEDSDFDIIKEIKRLNPKDIK